MSKKFTSINGITIHVCRKNAKFAFGKSNVFAVRVNEQEFCFDIYIREADGLEDRINYFKEFWGPGFRVIEINPEEKGLIPTSHGNISDQEKLHS